MTEQEWFCGNTVSKPKLKKVSPDIEYNLARFEGQLAKLDTLINWSACSSNDKDEFVETLKMAKQFLAALRLALDPHRIDVV